MVLGLRKSFERAVQVKLARSVTRGRRESALSSASACLELRGEFRSGEGGARGVCDAGPDGRVANSGKRR